MTLKTERHHHNGSAHAAFNACIEGMFTVCHTEEAELLPPQLLPRCPVNDTILIWFLILFPMLSLLQGPLTTQILARNQKKWSRIVCSYQTLHTVDLIQILARHPLTRTESAIKIAPAKNHCSVLSFFGHITHHT